MARFQSFSSILSLVRRVPWVKKSDTSIERVGRKFSGECTDNFAAGTKRYQYINSRPRVRSLRSRKGRLLQPNLLLGFRLWKWVCNTIHCPSRVHSGTPMQIYLSPYFIRYQSPHSATAHALGEPKMRGFIVVRGQRAKSPALKQIAMETLYFI
jgi:hypothetical protein